MQPQRTGGRGAGLPTGGAASRLDIPRVNTTNAENAAAIRSDFVIIVLLVKPATVSFYSIPAYAVNNRAQANAELWRKN